MSARGADLGSDIIGSGSDPEVKLFRKWIRSQRKKNINPGPKWKNYRFKFFSSISWKNVEKVKIFEIFLHCFREAGIFFELQKKLLFLSGPYPPLPPPLNGWATQKNYDFCGFPYSMRTINLNQKIGSNRFLKRIQIRNSSTHISGEQKENGSEKLLFKRKIWNKNVQLHVVKDNLWQRDIARIIHFPQTQLS